MNTGYHEMSLPLKRPIGSFDNYEIDMSSYKSYDEAFCKELTHQMEDMWSGVDELGDEGIEQEYRRIGSFRDDWTSDNT